MSEYTCGDHVFLTMSVSLAVWSRCADGSGSSECGIGVCVDQTLVCVCTYTCGDHVFLTMSVSLAV